MIVPVGKNIGFNPDAFTGNPLDIKPTGVNFGRNMPNNNPLQAVFSHWFEEMVSVG
jgi:hypothetical protein